MAMPGMISSVRPAFAADDRQVLHHVLVQRLARLAGVHRDHASDVATTCTSVLVPLTCNTIFGMFTLAPWVKAMPFSSQELKPAAETVSVYVAGYTPAKLNMPEPLVNVSRAELTLRSSERPLLLVPLRRSNPRRYCQ